jgi:hypothetical protein
VEGSGEGMRETGCAPFSWLQRPQWEGSAQRIQKVRNVLLADSTKKKYSIEQHRLALEEDRAKKEDRRIALEEARVQEQKDEREMNREFMMSVISMMKVMSDNLTKLNDSKK